MVGCCGYDTTYLRSAHILWFIYSCVLQEMSCDSKASVIS